MAEAPKRCHYEVLGVSRDASADEIRSAYRRLALQLHPDKRAASGVSPAEATAAFQELLHSYEVLSDPKERAWYDSHRSQILFSDPKLHRSSSPFYDLDLYAFFSASCFSGFSDSGKGFYKVYGDVFSKIHSQELYFAEKMGLGLDSVPPAPLIGNLDSPYAQVTAFYNYWLGYSTVMDFAWVDEYDASSGPNRRSRRFMEEENKKIRKKAKRERNELVRGLAAFAKKRDKRVIDMVIKKSQEEEKRRADEKAKRKEEEKRKLDRARMYEEPEWATIHENEGEVSFDEFDYGRKKEKGGEEFYCVACNKKFKSDKQWKNHEQSKKHKEKVAELKDAFKEEDEACEDADDGVEGARVEFDFEMPPEDGNDTDEIDELCDEMRNEVVLENEEKGEDSDEKIGSYDEASILEAMANGQKNRAGYHGSFYDPSFNKNFCHDQSKEDAREQHQENSMEDAREQHQENSMEDKEEGSSHSFEDPVARNKGNEGDGKSKKKQKKQQVVGKGFEKKVEDHGGKNKGRKQKGSSKLSSNNTCGTCGDSFDSREISPIYYRQGVKCK